MHWIFARHNKSRPSNQKNGGVSISDPKSLSAPCVEKNAFVKEGKREQNLKLVTETRTR